MSEIDITAEQSWSACAALRRGVGRTAPRNVREDGDGGTRIEENRRWMRCLKS